jgi:endonuclease III
VQLSSPPATPGPQKVQKRKAASVEKKNNLSAHSVNNTPATPQSTTRKRQRTTAVKDEDIHELPHNLGSIPDVKSINSQKSSQTLVTKTKKSTKRVSLKKDEAGKLLGKATSAPAKSPKKGKSNTYGLTPGQSPYPNYPHPTAEECHEVNRLLSTVHGKVQAPKTIPTPSLTVSGCGEVPSVLDALIRTRLSAATSASNSSRAFAGLVAKFGILKEGIGKGSVDWNKVRLADTKEVFEAIKSGGLADVKSKDIKKILQMVWEENQERKNSLEGSSQDALGSANETLEEKNAEVTKADEDVISLDHLHLLSNDDAFNALIKYPGIGPKTASCVLLFCLQRPSFAVDTHVFRLTKWLGWVPPPGDERGLAPGAKGKFAGPSRNSTYAHLETRIPDDLKYPLHHLLIKHGRACPRCRAITGENSEGWEKGCVIDHLVQRSGSRKSASESLIKKARKGGKRFSDEESEAVSSDSSLPGSEVSDIDFSAEHESP